MKRRTKQDRMELFLKAARAAAQLDDGPHEHAWYPLSWVCRAGDVAAPTARRWARQLEQDGAVVLRDGKRKIECRCTEDFWKVYYAAEGYDFDEVPF